MSAPHSDALVFFGATGDLAFKQIFPALQALTLQRRLNMPIIGVAYSHLDLEQFKERARDSISQNGKLKNGKPTLEGWEQMSNRLQYVDGDYEDKRTFVHLAHLLADVKHPLYYLAIPPELFSVVVNGLAKAGQGKEARVVVEKPFGRDLPSAHKLNATLLEHFPERDIYRIDHYLGKETVQNLVFYRFANPVIEAGWSNQHIDSVQITMAEKFGVKGRGSLYEELGAVRDVVQNHMLHLIACLAMEWPQQLDNNALRDARGQLLKCIAPLSKTEIVRGQYMGYTDQKHVAPDSKVETFFAGCFRIENPRWKGVPFYVRAGKCLHTTCTEVMVRIRPSVRFGPASGPFNYYRFRISPEMVIALGTQIKKPGEKMEGENVELIAREEEPDAMQPYQRLLGDVILGDSTLFAREDAVDASWRAVAPALDEALPLFQYAQGSWGPAELDNLLRPSGGWHNPS